MGGIFASYPYLWSSAAILAIAAALIALNPGKRHSLVAAGLTGMLFGLFSFEFIPWYWNPQVVAHFIASPEDLIFSFGTGTIVWWLALWYAGESVSLDINLKRNVLRGILFAAPGIAIAYSLGLTVMNHMAIETTLIGVSCMGIAYVWLKREFVPAVFFSSIGFTVLHIAVMKAGFAVWPDFILAWNQDVQPPFTIFGLPPFEIFWALGYGFVFPLYLTLVFQATKELPVPVFQPEQTAG